MLKMHIVFGTIHAIWQKNRKGTSNWLKFLNLDRNFLPGDASNGKEVRNDARTNDDYNPWRELFNI